MEISLETMRIEEIKINKLSKLKVIQMISTETKILSAKRSSREPILEV